MCYLGQEEWVNHLYDDWDAVVGRAKGLWAPRWRTASHGGLTAAAPAAAATAVEPPSAALNAQAVAMSGTGGAVSYGARGTEAGGGDGEAVSSADAVAAIREEVLLF